MNYMLDIIIPKGELHKINLLEVTREWGGIKYSLSPPLYVTDTNLEFIEVSDLSYYNRTLGAIFDDELICLHLQSDVLYEFESFANNKFEQITQNDLLEFLKSIFKLSYFYILLIREDELVKDKYIINSVEMLEAILLSSVNWSSPNDVLLYKNA